MGVCLCLCVGEAIGDMDVYLFVCECGGVCMYVRMCLQISRK